jgi:3-oxoacyl-[acyl-carrier-protein] synthase-3
MSNSSTDVGIAGLGYAIPERRVDNNYFTRFVETSDEWVVQRTGIKERRWLEDHRKPSDLFTEAAAKALEDSGLAPEDIELIVLCTVSGDQQGLPASACIIQENLGCKNAAAFDVQAACAGFVYGLSIGSQYIKTGTYKNVLIIGGEALSRIADIYDRNSVIIFADGAGAAVLQPHSVCKQGLIEDLTLGADGSGAQFITRPLGGAADPITPEILAEGTHLIRLEGRQVYRFAVSRMVKLMRWGMEGQDPDDLGLMVPHQVNRRILEKSMSMLDIDEDKMFINIDYYGNTSAGSVPIALSEARDQGRLEKGKLIILAAFGAGLTWGGARIRW